MRFGGANNENADALAIARNRDVACFIVASGKVDARMGKWGQFDPFCDLNQKRYNFGPP